MSVMDTARVHQSVCMEANTLKTIAVFLIAVLALNASGFALQTNALSASPQEQPKETKQAARAKDQVQKRGSGEQSRVRVSLRDGTQVNGYISKVEEDSFEVTDRKSGRVVAINYKDVDKVKGSGLSKPAQVFIVVGIFAGVVAAIFWAIYPKT